MTFTTVTLVLAALYFLFIATAMSTSNIQSSIIFKFIPAILAICLGAIAADISGFITIGG